MFIVSILLLAILALGAVSASEDIVDDASMEMEPIDDVVIEESSDDSQEEILTEGDSSLTDFKNEVTNGGEINLSHDYQYDSSKDSGFTNITSSKAYVLNGNGHTIDGNGKDMEILIKGDDVVIKNTVFKNFYRSSNNRYDSLIYWYASRGRLENCTFENINASGTGVVFNNFYDFDMVNCTFKNCHVEWDVAYVDISGAQVIDCNFINNTGRNILYLYGSREGNLLNNCSFIENVPKEYLIQASGSEIEQISNCRFINNNASQGGNYLVELSGPYCRMENCSFTGNVMGDGAKSIFRIIGNGSTIKNCSFEDNHIGHGKGIVLVGYIGGSSSNPTYNSPDSSVSNCSFKDNSGIPIIWNAKSGDIYDCTFINNFGQVQSNGIVTLGDGICDLSVKNVSNETSLGRKSSGYDYSDVLVYLEAQTPQQGNVLVYLDGAECCNETINGYNVSICTNSIDNVKCGLSDILVKFICNDGTEMLLYEGKVFIDYYVYLSGGNYYGISPHDNMTGYVYLPKGFTGTVTFNDGIQTRILSLVSGNALFTLNGVDYGLGLHYFNISLSNDPFYPDKTIESRISIVPSISYPDYVSVGEEAYVDIDLPDDYDGTITILNDSDYYYGDVIKEISGLKGITKFSITDLLEKGLNIFYVNCSGVISESIYTHYIENDPEVSSSIDSNTIEYGDNATIRVTLPDSSYYLYYVYVDGDSWLYVALEGDEHSYKIPYVPVGEHIIEVLVYRYGEPVYLNQFSLTVKEKAKPDTNSSNSTKPVTVPAKVVAKDYSAYYNKGTYSVTVYGTDGKVAKNTTVVFKINGKKVATVKTNSKGVAKLKIPTSYVPKTYKISATALGKTVTKKLTVKQVLTLKAVTIKKSAKKLVISATLKEGKNAIKSKKITFKFNGKTYTAKTNKKGVAKITIKKSVLKKLKVGKKVVYQATYIKDTVKKTAKVKK